MTLKLLADESCDFAIVRGLRAASHDLKAVAEEMSGASDLEVLQKAIDENRLLLTEDKDFGEWVFAHGSALAGVIFFRYPSRFRKSMTRMACELINQKGLDLIGSFTVVEPGRYRMRGMSK